MKEFVSRMADSVADFFGTAAAKYRRYLDDANAQARAEAQVYNTANLLSVARPEYDLYAQVMMEAINNTSDATHLRTVERVSQVRHRNWLKQLPSGLYCFQFRGRYLRGFGMTRDDINRILQDEVDQLCSDYGCHGLVIKVFLRNDGALTIEAVYFADAHRYRMEKLKKVQI